MSVPAVSGLLAALLVLAVAAGPAAATECTAAECLPNINVLGSAFDILSADVIREAIKIGGPIFRFDSYKPLSSNEPFLVPGNATSSVSGQSCSGQGTVRAVSSTRDYYMSWAESESSGVKVGVSVASFGASESSKQAATSNVYKSRSDFAYLNQARCSIYDVQLIPSSIPLLPLEERFVQAVLALPTSWSTSFDCYRAFGKFIAQFGTHFVTRLELGGYATQLVTVDMYDDAVFNAIEGSSESAASFGFQTKYLSVSANTGGSSSEEQKKYDAFTKISGSKCFEYVGGDFATEGTGWDTWKTTVARSPVPISMEWRLLSSLLTAEHFPFDAEIAKRQEALRTATWMYVQAYGGLSNLYPTPRRQSSALQETKAYFRTMTVSCEPGEVLLGVGCHIPQPPNETEQLFYLAAGFPRSFTQATCTGAKHGNADPVVQDTAVIPVAMCVPETLDVDLPIHIPGVKAPTAVSVNTTIERSTVEVHNKAHYHASASCPADSFLSSGGCVWTSENEYYYRMTRSSPGDDDNSWECDMDVDMLAAAGRYSSNPTFTAYAVCAQYSVNATILSYLSELPLKIQRKRATGDVGDWQSTASAQCDPGYVVIGGGCDAHTPHVGDYPMSLVQSAPGSDNSWSCRARLAIGLTQPQAVTAYAICALYQLESVTPSREDTVCSKW